MIRVLGEKETCRFQGLGAPKARTVLLNFCHLSSRQLGLDLVPRKEYVVVDPEDVSITELYRLVGTGGLGSWFLWQFSYSLDFMRTGCSRWDQE